MWERVKKLSSTNNDAVRVTLSSDSKEISEKMNQSQDCDQTIDSTTDINSESNETRIDEAEVVEVSENNNETEQINDDTETIETDTAEEKEDEQKIEKDEKDENLSEDKLDKTLKENKELQDRLLRISAEFENFKKRNRREMSEFKKFASEVLIKDLLPVVDNLDRALETTSTDEASKAINEGVSMTRDEMLRVFSKYGVQPVEALEKDFDPAFHQAVGQEEDAECPKNKVLKEYQKGYTIHGRLLRPSMVIVSS
jgi:molecular chaperone GrpE